jgi:uncharacterized protein DUF1059
MAMVKVIRCDCGFEVSGTAEELVSRARAHARDVHQRDLPAELLAALAGGGGPGLRPTP